MKTGLVIFILCCAVSSYAITPRHQYNYANEKKYAVAYCLAKSYPDSEFSSDALYVSGAYIQKGSFDFDIYDQIRKYVATYRKKPYLSKHGKNLNIMQCIDLYQSKELETILNKYGSNKH